MRRYASTLQTKCACCDATFYWLPTLVMAVAGSGCPRCGGELQISRAAEPSPPSRPGRPARRAVNPLRPVPGTG